MSREHRLVAAAQAWQPAADSMLTEWGEKVTPDDALWYHRSIELAPKTGKRYLLNFEAIDYESTVWINGKELGKHCGGNLPFSFDITGALKAGNNTLLVRVTDATDSAW